MSTPNERLVTAQWILERNLGWVAAAGRVRIFV